jgi:Tfp pilus assembly protein PilW
VSLKINGKGLRGIQGSAAGASLVELLVVLAITGVVTTGIYSFFLTTTQTNADQAINARMLQTGSNAMSTITRDLRQAGTFWATPCAIPPLVTTPLVSATNVSPGSIAARLFMDDPSARTDIAATPPAGQAQTSPTFAVVSTAGFQVGNTAFITDGVQCTSFAVTGTSGGLEHIPANDVNSPGGAGYVYPVATSRVYRQIQRTITYTIDTSDPNTPWLTRDTGSGPGRLVPDVESLNFAYIMKNGSTVADPATIVGAAQAADIRAVTVSLRVKADTRDALLRDFRRQTLVATIKLRNLGS